MYRKSNKGWLKHGDFLLIDMFSLEVSLFLAYMLRHRSFTDLVLRESYYRMIFALLLIEFSSVAILRTLSGVMRRGYFDECIATLRQVGLVTLLSVLYLFSIQEGESYSRITLFLTGIIYFFISYLSRCLWKKILKDRKPVNNQSMIIITTENEAAKMIGNIKENYTNKRITGLVLVDVSKEGEQIDGIDVVANTETVEKYVLSHWVDEVLLGLSVDSELLLSFQKIFLEMGITVHQALLEVQNDSSIGRKIERVCGYTVITRSIKIMSTSELVLKRVMDIAGGIIGCIITGILFLFIAPAIYIASPGPIFFTQDRIGKNGKVFKMYKFRSMYVDAEEKLKDLKDQNKMANDLMFKMEYDPRIIGSEKGPNKGIGNFIRRTSIDEFPQFYNCLTGTMSLVGTRPPLISEWNQYKNHHRARMATKPGITGMWQVSGRSNITDFEEVVDLDMKYIENWSFGLDLKILFKTVIQVLKHEGAS